MATRDRFIENVQTLLRAAEFIDRANEHGYAQSPSSSSSSLSSSLSSSPFSLSSSFSSSSLPTYHEMPDSLQQHYQQHQQHPQQQHRQQQQRHSYSEQQGRQRCNSSSQTLSKKGKQQHNIYQSVASYSTHGNASYNNNKPSNGSSSNQHFKSSRCKKRRGTKLRRSSTSRGSHNELEKNRRAHMRDCLDQLKRLVPLPSEHTRHTTLGLLMDAEEMVKRLSDEDMRQEAELLRLQHEQAILLNKLKNHHQLKAPNNTRHLNNNNNKSISDKLLNRFDNKFNSCTYNNNNSYNNNNNASFRYRSKAHNSESSGSGSPLLHLETDQIDILGSASSSPIQSESSIEENSSTGSYPGMTTIHQSFSRIL